MTASRTLPVWRNRDYMILWGGQVVSVMGTGIAQISLPLLVLSLTHSAVNVS